MKEKTVVYQYPETMTDLEIAECLGNFARARADELEITYQGLRHLRDIAADILPEKIQTSSKKRQTQDFEAVCNTILFSFDARNFHAVAQRLGVTEDALPLLLIVASTGARLQRQKA